MQDRTNQFDALEKLLRAMENPLEMDSGADACEPGYQASKVLWGTKGWWES